MQRPSSTHPLSCSRCSSRSTPGLSNTANAWVPPKGAVTFSSKTSMPRSLLRGSLPTCLCWCRPSRGQSAWSHLGFCHHTAGDSRVTTVPGERCTCVGWLCFQLSHARERGGAVRLAVARQMHAPLPLMPHKHAMLIPLFLRPNAGLHTLCCWQERPAVTPVACVGLDEVCQQPLQQLQHPLHQQ